MDVKTKFESSSKIKLKNSYKIKQIIRIIKLKNQNKLRIRIIGRVDKKEKGKMPFSL